MRIGDEIKGVNNSVKSVEEWVKSPNSSFAKLKQEQKENLNHWIASQQVQLGFFALLKYIQERCIKPDQTIDREWFETARQLQGEMLVPTIPNPEYRSAATTPVAKEIPNPNYIDLMDAQKIEQKEHYLKLGKALLLTRNNYVEAKDVANASYYFLGALEQFERAVQVEIKAGFNPTQFEVFKLIKDRCIRVESDNKIVDEELYQLAKLWWQPQSIFYEQRWKNIHVWNEQVTWARSVGNTFLNMAERSNFLNIPWFKEAIQLFVIAHLPLDLFNLHHAYIFKRGKFDIPHLRELQNKHDYMCEQESDQNVDLSPVIHVTLKCDLYWHLYPYAFPENGVVDHGYYLIFKDLQYFINSRQATIEENPKISKVKNWGDHHFHIGQRLAHAMLHFLNKADCDEQEATKELSKSEAQFFYKEAISQFKKAEIKGNIQAIAALESLHRNYSKYFVAESALDREYELADNLHKQYVIKQCELAIQDAKANKLHDRLANMHTKKSITLFPGYEIRFTSEEQKEIERLHLQFSAKKSSESASATQDNKNNRVISAQESTIGMSAIAVEENPQALLFGSLFSQPQSHSRGNAATKQIVSKDSSAAMLYPWGKGE